MPTIRQIVLELREALAKKVGDVSRVYVIAGRKKPQVMPALVGEKDIFIRVGGFVTNGPTVEAAGRSNTLITRQFDIIMRSRMAIDRTGTDLQWLTKEGLGHLEYEDDIFDVVQMWMSNIADSVDGALVAEERLMVGDGEPLRVTAGSDAVRDFESVDGKWGASAFTVPVVYRQIFSEETA